MPRKSRCSLRKRFNRPKRYSHRPRKKAVEGSAQIPITIDDSEPSYEKHVLIEDLCGTGEEVTSVSDSSVATIYSMHHPSENNEPVALKHTSMNPRKQTHPTRNDKLTAPGDSESADVVWCVTMPAQSGLRRGEIDMTVYTLPANALHSTSESSHLGSTVQRGTQRNLNKDNIFTVVGMELTESSDDSSDNIVVYPVKQLEKAPVGVPAAPVALAAPREVSVTQQLLDGVSRTRSHSQFLINVKTFLTDRLALNWACAAVDNKILVMLMSRADVLCAQRQLTFDLNGKVSLCVHGGPLPDDHDLLTMLPPIISNLSNSVEEFSQYILSVVNLVRRFDICKGLQDERFGKYSHILKGDMIYDDNKYKEARYTTTHRSASCFKLIVLPKQKCMACTRLKSLAERRIKTYESPNPPNPRTNKRYLALYGNHVPETPAEKKIRQFCRVQNCKNVRESWTQNLTLFRAPSDRQLLEKWVQLSGLTKLLSLPIDRLKRFLTVCHLHFAENDIKGTEVTKILKQNAIPVKFPEGHAPLSESDMNEWRSSKHYKQFWKRLQPKKSKASKNVIERCPNLPVNSVALNCEPNGPFPCLYCETVHSMPTSTQEECLSFTVPERVLGHSSSASEFEGTTEIQEAANILLSL